MKPVAQTLFRPSEGDGAGNCLAAALASVLHLTLDEVPNFAARPKETWQQELDDWLVQFGLAALPLDCHTAMPWLPARAWVLIVGKSPRGNWNHIIVGRISPTEYEYVHDPHPSGSFIDGDPICIWVFLALNPSDLSTQGIQQ